MRPLVVLAAVTLMPATLGAQSKWLTLGNPHARRVFSVDSVDINLESPAHVGGWFRLGARTGALTDGKPYAFVEAYVVADCGAKSVATPRIVYYSAAGAVVNSVDVSQFSLSYSHPVPDSYADAQLKYLCSVGLRKTDAARQ